MIYNNNKINCNYPIVTVGKILKIIIIYKKKEKKRFKNNFFGVMRVVPKT